MQACHDEPSEGTAANIPMESVSPLRDNDVLFGRGKGPQYHPGNVAFRALVDSRKADYWSENQEAGYKTQLANDIYDAIVTPASSDQPGGRFLKQEDDMDAIRAELQAGRSVSKYDGKYYIEVPRKLAVDKCKMALRQKVNAADQREARRRRKRLSASPRTEKSSAASVSSATVAAPDQTSSASSAIMGDATPSSLDQLDLPADLDSLQFLEADLHLLPLADATSQSLPNHHANDVNEGNASNAGKALGVCRPTTTADSGVTKTTPLCDGIQDLSLGDRGSPRLSAAIESALISIRMHQSALETSDGFDARSLGRILYDVFADASEVSDSSHLTNATPRADDGTGPAKRDRRNTASYQPLVTLGYPASVSHLVDFLLCQNPSEIFYSSSGEVESDLRGILRAKIGDDESNQPSQVGGRLYFDNNRLFGREEEIEILLSVYDRVVRDKKETRAFVTISGYSGTGKTSLVNQLSCRLHEDNASLIRCNFTEQGQSTTALFKAFDDYCRHVSGSEDKKWLGQMRRNVKDALGSNSHVLFGCLPSLRSFLCEENTPTPAAAETREDAMNQILFYFFKLVRAVSGPEHPIVFVLDDIQWCNKNTLELVKSMLRDTGIASALFIACYRDEEVGDDHCFADLFGELTMEASLPLVSISLQNVDTDGVNAFVSSVLHLNPRFTRPLAEVLHQKTQGNPMFVRQLLQSLVDDGLLLFSAFDRRWTWELGTIAAKPIATNSASFAVGMMQSYPEGIQNILRLAALLGTNCKQNLLENLLVSYGYRRQFDIAGCIRRAITLGVLVSDGSGVLYFSHDHLFQAARALTSSQEQPHAHLDIGRRLLKSVDGDISSLSPDFVTTIVDQYNEGIPLISDHEEELALVELNLLAGEGALASASYLQAAIYFLRGCGLVVEEDWENHYNTCLRLYTFSGEAQITQGMADGSIIAAKEVLKHGRTFDDKLPAQKALLTAYTIQGDHSEAIDHGLEVLRELGEDFPSDADVRQAASEADLIEICGILKTKSFDDIVCQSAIESDPTKILVMQVLMVVSRISYNKDPKLMLLLVYRMISRTMSSGLTSEASFAFAALSFALCGLGKYELSSFCARVATSLLQKFHQKYSHIVLLLLNSSILPYSQPQQACTQQLFTGYEDGMSVGAVEWALVNLSRNLQGSLFAPDPNSTLADYLKRIVKANETMVSFKHELNAVYGKLLHQAIHNLSSNDETSDPFLSLTCDEDVLSKYTPQVKSHVKRKSLTFRIWFGRLFGKYDGMKDMIGELQAIAARNPFAPSFDTHNDYFYIGLVAFAMLRSDAADKEYWKSIASTVAEKFDEWIEIGNDWNFLSKRQMLLAESAYCENDVDVAKAAYEEAIAKAKQTSFIHEEALACELAGNFYCERGDISDGRYFLEKAIETYTRWGAHRKAIHVKSVLSNYHSP